MKSNIKLWFEIFGYVLLSLIMIGSFVSPFILVFGCHLTTFWFLLFIPFVICCTTILYIITKQAEQ